MALKPQSQPPSRPVPRASKPSSRPPRARGYVAVVQQHPLVLAGSIIRVFVFSAMLFALVGGITTIFPLAQAEVVLFLVISVMVSVGWLVWKNHQRRHTKLCFSQAGILLCTVQSPWMHNDLMMPREQCEITLVQNIFERVLNIGSIVVSTEQRQVRLHCLQGFNRVRQYVDWQIYQ